MQVPEPRKVLLAQGVYYVVTGVSPFVSRRLFEAVTGRKREWWLVETTGILVTAVGCGTVSPVYLADAALQLAAIAGSPLLRGAPDTRVGHISDHAPGRRSVEH